MSKITIGILIPSSTIYTIGKKFEQALRKVLKEDEGVEFEIIPEFVGQGEIKKVEEAISKMMEYHDVDIITGIVSSKVLTEVSAKFAGKKTILFVNNLGEQLIDPNVFQESNVLMNSNSLALQMWSLGHWAVNELGKKGMIVGSVYDVGYSFQGMLDLGMQAADKESKWSIAVCPMPMAGELSDPNVVVDYIEKDMPDYVFPAFCGEESTLFLDAFIKRGLHKNISIVSTPYLLEDFNERVDEPLKIYSTVLAGKDMKQEDLNSSWTEPFGVFEQMGLETGQAIINALKNGGLESLKRNVIETERGKVSFDYSTERNNKDQVYLIENNHSGDKDNIDRKLKNKLDTVDMNDDSVKQALIHSVSAWQNPYLSI